jgi:hypothetical protein
MRLRNQRDNQQWILLVKATGRDRHFFYNGRKFPAGTRSYAMIPRQTARVAAHAEGLAAAAEERDHRQTALRLYHKASLGYLTGIQALPFDDHPERIYLHEKLLACFGKVIGLSETRIERFEVNTDYGAYRACSIPAAARSANGVPRSRLRLYEGAVSGRARQCLRDTGLQRRCRGRSGAGRGDHAQDPHHAGQLRAGHDLRHPRGA